MTAVIHHGPPGSYKSFAIVQDVVIPALKKGRTVITNIRGLDDVNHIAETMGFELPETASLQCVKHDSQEGFEYMARFFHWAPPGALIVMDEGQRVYPTRLRSLSEFDLPEDQHEEINGIQRPANVENAFDQHRHMNWDIYISTTNVAKIHKEVRAVAEYAFRHRDMAGVLPWYKNKWREFKHDPETTGKSVAHYIGTPVLKKADPRVFDCYQSTATGVAKGSNENKSIFNDPKLRIFIGIIVLAISYFVYNVFEVMGRYSSDIDVAPEAVTPPYVGGFTDADPGNGDEVSAQDSAIVDDEPILDIVSGRTVYYTGTFIVHNFDLISDKDVIHLTSLDFNAAGYAVEKVSECLVKITAPGQYHVALCSPEPLENQQSKYALASPL